MKTSHQFASELLAGPDLPIVIHLADDTDDVDKFGVAAFSISKASPFDGEPQDIVVLGSINKSVREPSKPETCPHAHPFAYCPQCVACPCPIGLGK